MTKKIKRAVNTVIAWAIIGILGAVALTLALGTVAALAELVARALDPIMKEVIRAL